MPKEETRTADGSATDRLISPGVREIAHTADLGMTVQADTLEELFRRAASGMMALVRSDETERSSGREAESGTGETSPNTDVRDVAIDLPKNDIGALLVRWLRELLYLQEVDGFVYDDAHFERLDESGLRTTVTARSHPTPPIRELKGVTYHGLEVERGEGGWRARVIFDI